MVVATLALGRVRLVLRMCGSVVAVVLNVVAVVAVAARSGSSKWRCPQQWFYGGAVVGSNGVDGSGDGNEPMDPTCRGVC